MRYRYVMTMQDGGMGWQRTLVTEDVTGAVAELTVGLRPWAMAYLDTGPHDNGWYAACLVEVDDDGYYDTYLAVAWTDILWYWDEEHVAASSVP